MPSTATNVNSVDDAIQAFAAAADEPPDDALRWSLAHWDEAAPRFLRMLEAYSDGSDESDVTTDALLFIVHLLGDKGEQRVYRPLCRLMLNEDRLTAALDDETCVGTLKGILIRCFDGDASPLREVIESTEADSITRGEALLAMAWLARDGRMPEAEFRDYLRRLLTEMQPRGGDYIWYNWVVVAAILGYEEFNQASNQLIVDGMVPEDWLTLAELPDLVAAGDPVGTMGLLAEEVEPFEDVIAFFVDWPWSFDDEPEDDPAFTPYINPLRHVGRNDPCPCGSGKKFKNCCLAGE